MHKAELVKYSPVELSQEPYAHYRELANAALELVRGRQSIDHWHTLALTDIVTGLPNRLAFNEDITDYSDRVKNDPRRRVGIGFLDLDEFKAANDRYGHDFGDEILKFTAQTLESAVLPYGNLYRLGGDEFAILFHRVSELRNDPEGYMWKYALELENLMASAYEASPLRKVGLRVGASIAIVRSEPGETVESLIQRADAAMYERKRSKQSNH